MGPRRGGGKGGTPGRINFPPKEEDGGGPRGKLTKKGARENAPSIKKERGAEQH